jgi:hypothetical protein
MKRHFVGVLVIVLSLVLYSAGASADVINQLNATFQSGATFTGLLTFTDGYNAVTAVNGTLAGGSLDVSPYAINLVWFGTPTPVGPGVNADFLMGPVYNNGTQQHYIELDWDTNKTTLVLDNAYSFYGQGYLPNAIDNLDQIVSYQATPVPEPSALLLLGPGFAGLVVIRRRLKK